MLDLIILVITNASEVNLHWHFLASKAKEEYNWNQKTIVTQHQITIVAFIYVNGIVSSVRQLVVY